MRYPGAGWLLTGARPPRSGAATTDEKYARSSAGRNRWRGLWRPGARRLEPSKPRSARTVYSLGSFRLAEFAFTAAPLIKAGRIAGWIEPLATALAHAEAFRGCALRAAQARDCEFL